MLDYEEPMCANCGTYKSFSLRFYHLDNDDYICSQNCFLEYMSSYFNLKTLKGPIPKWSYEHDK